MTKLKLILPALILASCSAVDPAEQEASEGRLTVERITPLNTPRGDASVLLLGDELTVFGGHTDGFVLLQSAEYLKDGMWHSVPMTYPHDFGFTTLLPDGRVMLGGGCAETFGIGQTFGVEVYDPASHSFTPLGLMSRKRMGVSALALPDGRVLISGNGLADDDLEMYEPGKGFSRVKDLASGRSRPYIIQTSADNAIIFATEGNRFTKAGPMVDCFQGEAYYEPILEQWHPLYCDSSLGWADQKIGDYTYLIAARGDEDGRVGILKLSGQQLSLIETDRPIPDSTHEGGPIDWRALKVDRARRLAYLVGLDGERRYVIATIDYNPSFDGGLATVSMASTSEAGFPISGHIELLPGGRIVCIGGIYPGEDQEDPLKYANLHTSADAYIIHTEPPVREKTAAWPWILASALLLCIAAGVAFWRRKQSRGNAAEEPIPASKTLAEQIAKLIEQKQLYLQKGLRLSDVAAQLATNKTYISAVVNSVSGTNFTDLINSYRVEYAKKLMKEHPDMRHEDVADAAGFSSRTAFLRVFKKHTGLSPTEWKEQ